MIINVRGANGSGKSVLVKSFLTQKRYFVTPLFGLLGARRPEAYRVDFNGGQPLYILGPYQTATGGTDVLCSRGLDAIITLLDKYSAKGHVLFEGVIFSVTFGIIGEWLERNKDRSIVAFLDVPLDKCIASIKARSGDSATFGRVKSKMPPLAAVKKRMIGLGMRVETITRENGFEKIRGWLQ